MLCAFRELGVGGVGVGDTAPHSFATLATAQPWTQERVE